MTDRQLHDLVYEANAALYGGPGMFAFMTGHPGWGTIGVFMGFVVLCIAEIT